jgi:hypothetical protein
MPAPKEGLMSDVVCGAGPLAKLVYGADTPQNRRRVYYAAEQKILPTFKWGNSIASTQPLIRQLLSEQISAAAAAAATAAHNKKEK